MLQRVADSSHPVVLYFRTHRRGQNLDPHIVVSNDRVGTLDKRALARASDGNDFQKGFLCSLLRLDGEKEQAVRAFFGGIGRVGVIHEDFAEARFPQPQRDLIFVVRALPVDFGK